MNNDIFCARREMFEAKQLLDDAHADLQEYYNYLPTFIDTQMRVFANEEFYENHVKIVESEKICEKKCTFEMYKQSVKDHAHFNLENTRKSKLERILMLQELFDRKWEQLCRLIKKRNVRSKNESRNED